ncbi:hypothetical protein [Pseudomonas syringae]|uniref:hypothetical protein n=1 Tax=Pseudomonas syringae TaxID=317 RepID=UPI00147A6C29|nr:hypothetical protein [Pseudomonas syringae]
MDVSQKEKYTWYTGGIQLSYAEVSDETLYRSTQTAANPADMERITDELINKILEEER